MGRRPGEQVRPPRAEAERQELLKLLAAGGILHRSDTQPVVGRDGTPARWMLDSLPVTLTPQGAKLAARCLLAELASFTGRQLATYGLTGVPLLQGCVLEGKGRYSGILVRKERKAHGSMKLIEGPLDLSEPVVIVDDSISSGMSMGAAADALEAAGLQVEGCVCLVRFDYSRGMLRMAERGYRVASVFDIFTDFMATMAGEEPILYNPTKRFGLLTPAPCNAPNGLHPADLARDVIAEYLQTGRVVEAPERMDREYDSSGGCWVSLRRRDNIYQRPARSGFWHFPDDQPPDGRATPAGDVVLASVRTAQQLQEESKKVGKDPATTLADCAVGVTFFSALEECSVGDLDNDRFGIVVRSKVRPWCMGGALPRMPGILNEWQQFTHARTANARLSPLEPQRLYRHDLEKVIGPGDTWQPTGVPASASIGVSQPREQSVVGPWAEWARDLVVAAVVAPGADSRPEPSWPTPVPPTTGGGLTVAAVASSDTCVRPLPPSPTPAHPTEGGDLVFVTVYSHGHLAGCMGGPAGDLAATLPVYARAAARDSRFDSVGDLDRLSVSVSHLFHRHQIGVAEPTWVVRPFRFADQALEVSQGDRRGLLLPFLAVMHNLTPLQYVYEVIDKAGITRPPYRWTRYDCATWLADGTSAVALVHGLPRPPSTSHAPSASHALSAPAAPASAALSPSHGLSVSPTPSASPALSASDGLCGPSVSSAAGSVERLRPIMIGYARRHHVADGVPTGRYEVFANRRRTGLAPARWAFGAWIKARVGLRAEAVDDLQQLSLGMAADGWIVLDDAASISELAFFLLAQIQLGAVSSPPSPSLPSPAAVGATLWGQIDSHGRFATHRDTKEAHDGFQDYSPGQALLALAIAAETGVVAVDTEVLRRSLRFYRLRFQQNHHWGAVTWLIQAFSAWGRVESDRSLTAFAYEIADWALQFQSRKSGAFLNDHQSDSPGATTALYLEGLAVAAQAARRDGKRARERRYLAACARGLGFLDGLVYQERDRAVLPNPDWAIGGLRTSLTSSDVRIDYVMHALAAMDGIRGLDETLDERLQERGANS